MSFGAAQLGATPLGGTSGDIGATYLAVGSAVTAFGTPFGVFSQFLTASPLGPTTSFGTPNVFPGYVPGFQATNFGSVLAQQYWRAATFGPLARVSTAYYSFAQSVATTGQRLSQFGTPIGTRRAPYSAHTSVRVSGSAVTVFGAPTSALVFARTAGATGFAAGGLGLPTALTGGSATGLQIGSFGTPTAQLRAYAAGWEVFAPGVHSALLTQRATGRQHATNFGMPGTFRPRHYPAYGIDRTGRFGQPSALRRFNYPASGTAGTAFGTPAATQRHRVAHIAPVASFGTPIVQRTPIC